MTPAELPQAVQTMLQTLQSGQSEAARAQAETILQSVPGEPNANQVLAMLHLQKGEADKAIPYLRTVDLAAPNHPPVLNMLGVAYKQYGRREEAREIFQKACEADPQFIDAWLNLAQLDLDDGRLEDARDGFERALAIQPDNATALAGRARAALLAHDFETARDVAERALALQPAHVLARLTLTVAKIRLKDFSGAREEALKAAELPSVSPTNRAYVLGFAGEAADRLGEYDEAFARLSEANVILADLHKDVLNAGVSAYSPDTIRGLKDRVEAGLGAAPACPADEPRPVFLLGFPRSGTTLLEQVLLAHPSIISHGEQMTLAEACGDLVLDTDGLDRLAALDEEEARSYRVRYWEGVAKLGKAPGDGETYLDKLPLNTALLPVIAKVFPRAKIVFALRDPRDVALSCFQQRFGINQAMYQFLDLETAARYYDDVMGLGRAARAAFEFDLREVRYENVVAGLEAEARAVIEFLGLEWDDGILDYREGARRRAIDTPSVGQVIEPVYERAMGKWRNYETHLAPVRSLLDPWARHFQYD